MAGQRSRMPGPPAASGIAHSPQPACPAGQVPATLNAAASPGAKAYLLYRAGASRTGGGRHGEYSSLIQAMAAAGHHGLPDWETRPGRPGLLFLSVAAARAVGGSVSPPWVIEAPGVAREFADAFPAAGRADRRWSLLDEQIIAAVVDETRHGRVLWRLPHHLTACQAGAWLAARYGTGSGAAGSVTTTDVHAVMTSAYRDAHPLRAVPEDVLDEIAGSLVRRLVAAQATVIGAQAVHRAAAAGAWPSVSQAVPAARPGRRPSQPADGVLAGLGAAAAAHHRLVRPIMRPARTIPIPAGRMTAWSCSTLSYLISYVIVPFGTLITGIALTCWPRPWQGWIGWILAALLIEKIVNAELRPSAGQEG